MVEPRAAIEIDVRDRQIPPAGAGGDDHRSGQDVLAVVEVDPREPLGAVGQLDGLVEARQDRVETARLQGGGAGQLGSRDAAGEAEVILDAAAAARLAARAPRLPDEGAEALGAGRDRRRSPAGPAPSTTTSKRWPSTSARRPELVGHLGGGGVPQHAVVAHEDGVSSRGISSQSRILSA